MLNWMLHCEQCDTTFAHSGIQAIAEQFSLFQVVSKPEFPNGGVSIECPNCQKGSVYQGHRLTCSKSKDGPDLRDQRGTFRDRFLNPGGG
jgi:hypothetical protein